MPPDGRVGLRDPRTLVRMPATGREVNMAGPDGAYWRRALRMGAVVEGEKPAPAKAPDAAPATPSLTSSHASTPKG